MKTLIGALLVFAASFNGGVARAGDNPQMEAKAFSSFLKSCGLRRGDVYFDRELTLYGKESVRMLMASGKEAQYLAALSDEGGYVYIKMPWRERDDLREARILDLAGDGRQALVVRYRERGSAGDTREVLGIWRLPSESHIRRVFAVETGRAVRVVKRGRANDLVVQSGNRRARYQFVGDEYRRL
jgi:hypothetical protein